MRIALVTGLALAAACTPSATPDPASKQDTPPPDRTSTAPDPKADSTSARQMRLAAWNALGFGMFVHWGLYSELGGMWQGKRVETGYSEQIQSFANIPAADYAQVAAGFKAARFDPDAICALARDAGARYVMVTSKHHDGFAMFATRSTDYNIVKATAFGKDAIGLISEACRKQGLGLGIYFSLVDWHAGHGFDPDNENTIPTTMEPLIEQQLTELMTQYGPITEVWFDMGRPTPEQSRKFAAIVHARQPQAVINGRIWNNQGDFVTLGDNQSPPPTMVPPFQTPASIYHSTWGYRSWQQRDALDDKVRDLVRGLVDVRSAGGNYLLNIGPRGDGSIVPFEADVLHRIGAWLRANDGAVIGAQPSPLPPQWWGHSTVNGDRLFVFIPQWRPGALRISGLLNDPLEARTNGDHPTTLQWHREGADVILALPSAVPDSILPVVQMRFAPPLRTQPDRAFQMPADRDLSLAPRSWRPGTSFTFGSGYKSQATSIVRVHTAIQNAADTPVWLHLPDAVARNGQTYRITVGTQVREIKGNALRTQPIGPFNLAAKTPTAVSIALANPDYPAQDMGLKFDTSIFGTQQELRPQPTPTPDQASDAHAH